MESRRKRVEDHENQLQTLRVQDAEEYNMVKIKLETDVQVGFPCSIKMNGYIFAQMEVLGNLYLVGLIFGRLHYSFIKAHYLAVHSVLSFPSKYYLGTLVK